MLNVSANANNCFFFSLSTSDSRQRSRVQRAECNENGFLFLTVDEIRLLESIGGFSPRPVIRDPKFPCFPSFASPFAPVPMARSVTLSRHQKLRGTLQVSPRTSLRLAPSGLSTGTHDCLSRGSRRSRYIIFGTLVVSHIHGTAHS